MAVVDEFLCSFCLNHPFIIQFKRGRKISINSIRANYHQSSRNDRNNGVMLKRQKNTHKTNMHRQLRKREEAEAERGTSIAYYALRQQHFTSPSMDVREKEQNLHTQLEE